MLDSPNSPEKPDSSIARVREAVADGMTVLANGRLYCRNLPRVPDVRDLLAAFLAVEAKLAAAEKRCAELDAVEVAVAGSEVRIECLSPTSVAATLGLHWAVRPGDQPDPDKGCVFGKTLVEAYRAFCAARDAAKGES
jgi:hypothetical protein